MTHTRRSHSIATISLLLAMSAVAGCKGGGGNSGSASAPATAAPTPDATGNHAPTISGAAPATVAANAAYTFAPQATDADGDQISFQIQNKPSWAAFNTVTGQLSGTPTTTHAGAYAGITITASDGKTSAALPAFTITVSQASTGGSGGSGGTGGATLSWTAPTENTDGTSLRDLAGFVIMYGESSTALTHSVRIENPSVGTYVLQDLPAGTHYFAIKAYAASGAESELSGTVSKQIG